MLDLSKPITVPILSGTEKRIQVIYPTDAQWCERARKQRVIRHFLGRGKSQTDDDSQADRLNFELLAKIRQDKDGPVLTPAEATLVLGKLERARVATVDREGDTFRIVLKTALGEVTHVVGIPTAEQMLVHERQSTKTTEGRRNQEIRGFLEPSGELYDKVAKSTEGYGAAVPIVHKVAVITELLAQITAEDEDLLPEA
jgi:hypothetical protein